MKKTFKRLGAVLLAAFMLLSTTICALADEKTPASTSTTSDTITLKVSNVADGDTVSAYKLVWYNTNGNGYEFDESFERYINTEKKKPDAQAYLAGLDATGVNTLLASYAAKCNEENSGYTLPNDKIDSKAASNDTASLEGLTPGYYLLLTSTSPTNNRIYMPLSAFVKMDGNDLVVYAGKNSDPLTAETDKSYKVSAKDETGPNIDKKTNATKGSEEATWKETAAAGVGETVRFYVQVNIPKYTDGTKLNLTVNDTLTNLEYKPNSAKVYAEKPELDAKGVIGNPTTIDDAIKNTTDIAGKYNTETGKQDLKFELDYEKIMKDATQLRTVYVYYEAIVKPEAVKNGKNEGTNVASLTYSNASNPKFDHTTDKETTKVFSYYLKLNKVKGEKTDSLHGAEFSVYTTEKSDTPLSFVKVSDDNGKTEYYRPAVGNEASSTSAVTKIEADFQIRGLDAGTYYLEEVKTPKGYTKPKGRFKIVMTSQFDENGEYTGKLDSKKEQTYMEAVEDADKNLVYAGSSADSNLMYQFSATIKNFSTPNLPTTGGTGTVLLSIGGVVLMAAGAYLLFFRKKKEN
ncbi:SpaA isopeptide-forming pilin-related protein [Butyricicoccus intestinisimiae]|uniref:LPXTG cell wall anchor domain-containing protein n=1 Tax=Butyricicoccus intestinisimiae TaxID=2841509 RepID=A0ABS6ENR4_9FIRM|nr:SpaA isopeptide-forming pilin-related protein [Butyricicoccus intestinisimiae]MBU5489316.1 LPXTG cell wall anchor domain-containing protein [Butyricicoccus intestinisimiae]